MKDWFYPIFLASQGAALVISGVSDVGLTIWLGMLAWFLFMILLVTNGEEQ